MNRLGKFGEHSKGLSCSWLGLKQLLITYASFMLSNTFHVFKYLDIHMLTHELVVNCEAAPLWPVSSFRLVGPKCPFPFDKIVLPSTTLLHPTYKNNNQMCHGLGCVCTPQNAVPWHTWNFWNFKLDFLLDRKRLMFSEIFFKLVVLDCVN